MTLRADARIEIDAPIDDVWAVLVDLRRYGEWNPFVPQVVDAPASVQVGTPLLFVVRWADGDEYRSKERVVQIDAPAPDGSGTRTATFAVRFAGWMHAPGLIRATRFQTLTELSGGRTEYRTVEELRGLLARYTPLAKVQRGFEDCAQALKAAAERPVRKAS